ncbi:DUF296 domain-containing protein [Candidatus Bathyarchaeota archaeon]|nr:DUF296 domain-containing protein [Candidatus Bathyarchaeota archaeon]
MKGRIGNIHFFRLRQGEDLLEAIKSRVQKCSVRAGIFLLIGTLKNAVLGYFKEGRYIPIKLDGPLEIASCIGNVAISEKGEIMVHAHLVVADEKGGAFGGHLMNGSIVDVTAELAVIEGAGVSLTRELDEKTGLRLWKTP